MAVIWQSSGFWFMICAVLLLLVGCTVINNRMVSSPSNIPNDLMSLVSIDATFFPPVDFVTPIDTTPFYLGEAQFYPPPVDSPPDRAPIAYPDIQIDDPTCYRLANSNYSCIGKVWNYSEQAIGDTHLRFSLNTLNTLGSNQLEQESANITLEQRMIPIGSFAPYRVTMPSPYYEANNPLFSPEILRVLHPMDSITALRTSVLDTRIESGRYHLTVTISNDSDFIVNDIRLFTTLDTLGWGIVGYNIHEVDNYLENGHQQALEIEVIPLALPAIQVITPVLHAEGLIISE